MSKPKLTKQGIRDLGDHRPRKTKAPFLPPPCRHYHTEVDHMTWTVWCQLCHKQLGRLY